MSVREHAWNDPWSFDVDALMAATLYYPVDGNTITTGDSVYQMPPFSSIKVCDGRIMHIWSSGSIHGGGATTNRAQYIMQGYAPDEATYCTTHNSVDTAAARTLFDTASSDKTHVIAGVSRVGNALLMIVTSDCAMGTMVTDADVAPWPGAGTWCYTSYDEGETWLNPLVGVDTTNPNFYWDGSAYQDWMWWAQNVAGYGGDPDDDLIEVASGVFATALPRYKIVTTPAAANDWGTTGGGCRGNNGAAYRYPDGSVWAGVVKLKPDDTNFNTYNVVYPQLARIDTRAFLLTPDQMTDPTLYDTYRALQYFDIGVELPHCDQVPNHANPIYDQWPDEYEEYANGSVNNGWAVGDTVTVTDVVTNGSDTTTSEGAWPARMLAHDGGLKVMHISNGADFARIYYYRRSGTRGALYWLDHLDDSLAQGALTWFERELTDGSVKHWWIRNSSGSWVGPCVNSAALTLDDFSVDAAYPGGSNNRLQGLLFRGDARIWSTWTVAASSNAVGLKATPVVEPPCRYPKEQLHIPYPRWNRELDGDGNLEHLWVNWLAWDRWVHRMVQATARPRDRSCGVPREPEVDKTCRIPHYRAANPAEHEQNWLAVERWSRQFCWAPHLHLPHKKPVQVHHDEQNWDALMRWVQTSVETGKTRHPGCPGQTW